MSFSLFKGHYPEFFSSNLHFICEKIDAKMSIIWHRLSNFRNKQTKKKKPRFFVSGNNQLKTTSWTKHSNIRNNYINYFWWEAGQLAVHMHTRGTEFWSTLPQLYPTIFFFAQVPLRVKMSLMLRERCTQCETWKLFQKS